MSQDFHQFIPPAADHPRRSAAELPDAALLVDRPRRVRGSFRAMSARLLRAAADGGHRLAARLEPEPRTEPEACAPQCG